jgi:hypothetical protein
MVVSNTERQKRFRARSKAAKTALGLDGLWQDGDKFPLERSRALLALMIEVMQRGSVEKIVESDDDDGGVAMLVRAALKDLSKEARQGLLTTCEWIPESTIRLWTEGYPVRFGIFIEAMVNKREAAAMRSRIEMQRWRRPPPK